MPNTVHPKIEHDGPRNAVVNIVGVLDDGNLQLQVVVRVSDLYAEPGYKITRLRIDTSDFHVDPGITVELLWEAAEGNHAHIISMTGKGSSNIERFGGRHNNAIHPTGNILITTQGYTEGRKTFSIDLELVKQFS